jgi:hypothetical protein
MSDLGRLFRLSATGPKPLENFTSTAVAIAINPDQRPMVEALRRVNRVGHETAVAPVLDLFSKPETTRPVIVADVQKTLWRDAELRMGYLDLVISVKDADSRESAIWVEVKVDAWESGDQIPVYLDHAARLSPKPDVITLGRTKITERVPFLIWRDVVDAVESVSNPHYTWVSLREFLLEEKIARPRMETMPSDVAACIDVIAEVNERIRVLWRGMGPNMAWVETPLRKMLAKISDAELVASAGPLIYGLVSIDGLWQWCLRVTVAKNYARVRLDPRQILDDAQRLPDDWIRQPDHLEVLERILPAGVRTSHDEIAQWFDEGLRQLRDGNVLRSYFAGVNAKRAPAGPRAASALELPEPSSGNTAD